MGRPAHQPTPTNRRTVEAMAAFGVPQESIASVLKISPKTLRQHYREELDTGATKALCQVAQSLFKKALGDGPQAVTAAIFIMKTRGGWKESKESPANLSHEDALAQLK